MVITRKKHYSIFAPFPEDALNGKQGECQHTHHFRLAKMLVEVAPQTRRRPLDTVSRGLPVCGPSRPYALTAQPPPKASPAVRKAAPISPHNLFAGP